VAQVHILSLVTILSALITLVMHGAAHVLLTQGKSCPRGQRPISVLRPLKGKVDELENNLESLMVQDHPQYEVIVAAADPTDPALEVARRVRSRYPRVPMHIVVGEWATGKNPKVRLLRKMLGRAKFDSVLISDDNVRVTPDYLAKMAGALARPGTGLVSNLVVGVGAKTVGAICENLQLNSFVLSSVAASFLVGCPVVVGKSMLFRRAALVNAGGFGAVADVLAEDHLLGRAVRAAGYRVATLGLPVYTVNVNWSVTRMLGRHIRWSKIRASIAPLVFPFEVLCQPLVLFAFTALVVGFRFEPPLSKIWEASAVMVALATLSEVVLAWRVQGRQFRAVHAMFLPLRSVLAASAHLASGFIPVVRWRNEIYRIGHNSRLLPVRGAMTPRSWVSIRRAA
jgi:ceramide glucosyltransferase